MKLEIEVAFLRKMFRLTELRMSFGAIEVLLGYGLDSFIGPGGQLFGLQQCRGELVRIGL